ncbi:hypothetical protein [Bacillus sp. HMF5848]|uniref:hypothetical protein n=1 Tax=Bacillus sp. HMF5848 TaxID=2495421 RepID=UPI001639B506|nr:hypothetical protein [Bacillus sp. HMF5848]
MREYTILRIHSFPDLIEEIEKTSKLFIRQYDAVDENEKCVVQIYLLNQGDSSSSQ